jgi:hypothetical protein
MSDVTGAVVDAQNVMEIALAFDRHRSMDFPAIPPFSPGHRIDRKEFKETFKAFSRALHETILYLAHLERGGAYDRQKEIEISRLWSDAAVEMAPFDPGLANRCIVKGNGWLDPKVWEHPEFKGQVSIAGMREAFMHWNLDQGGKLMAKQVPDWFKGAAMLFAAFAVVSLFYLVVGPGLPSDRKAIFNTWVAFCAACSLGFFGGEAAAEGRIPIPYVQQDPVRFTVVGGIGVFVIVLLLMFAVNG